ncbi:MAG: hypothetical protein ACK5KR_09080 [Breznakia sp.]
MKKINGLLIVNLVAIIAFMFTVNDNQYKDYQNHISEKDKLIDQLKKEKLKLQEERMQPEAMINKKVIKSEEDI